MAHTKDFDFDSKIVEMYIDCAKSYSQLSTGALALAAVFGPEKVQSSGFGFLRLACVIFLLAILCSGAYQLLAVGELEKIHDPNVESHQWIPSCLYKNAYWFYNAAVTSFHGGAITLALVVFFQYL